jgi:hypothetical protein
MRPETDLETSVLFGHLTRLIAREDFIEFSHRESYRSGIISLNSIKKLILVSVKFCVFFAVRSEFLNNI